MNGRTGPLCLVDHRVIGEIRDHEQLVDRRPGIDRVCKSTVAFEEESVLLAPVSATKQSARPLDAWVPKTREDAGLGAQEMTC
ncbi:MAG: hypothetical protein QOG04_2249 [Actinomycetota bacterium]|nr:hypothetical protein [Actinomycetota bacterium]